MKWIVCLAFVVLMVCRVGYAQATGKAGEAPATLVTWVDKDAVLKDLHFAPGREDATPHGWAMVNVGREPLKQGDIFQLAIAVCDSPETAQALYRRTRQYCQIEPQGQKLPVGDLYMAGPTWAAFVRDNVYVEIGWKDSFDPKAIQRLDKLLQTESPTVRRGQFTEIPKLKSLPAKVALSAGSTKHLPLTWTGFGERRPGFHVTSPGSTRNLVAEGAVELEAFADSQSEKFPVEVSAVGEGCVFARATVEVTIEAAATQPGK